MTAESADGLASLTGEEAVDVVDAVEGEEGDGADADVACDGRVE